MTVETQTPSVEVQAIREDLERLAYERDALGAYVREQLKRSQDTLATVKQALHHRE